MAEADGLSNRDDARGAQSGDRVETAAQHAGDLADENSADRSSAYGGDGPEQCGLDGAGTVGEGLARAGDGEEAEPDRVEDVDGRLTRRRGRLNRNARRPPAAATAR